MALPSCLCVAGRPPFERLNDIYCALTQVSVACVTPTLLSAVIGFSGGVITLTFDVKVTSDGSGFSIVTDSDTSTIAYLSGGGTTSLVFTMTPPAITGDSAFLFYDEFTGNAASGDCPLLQIDSFDVTNNTGVGFTYVQPNGFAYFQPDGVSLYLQP